MKRKGSNAQGVGDAEVAEEVRQAKRKLSRHGRREILDKMSVQRGRRAARAQPGATKSPRNQRQSSWLNTYSQLGKVARRAPAREVRSMVR